MNRAKASVLWFDAMATKAERVSLLPSAHGEQAKDVGEQRKVVARLHFLIKALLRTAFNKHANGVPRSILADKTLTVGAIQGRIDQLRKAGLPAVKVDDFTSFRAQFEESETTKRQAAAAPAAVPPSKKKRTATAAASLRGRTDPSAN